LGQNGPAVIPCLQQSWMWSMLGQYKLQLPMAEVSPKREQLRAKPFPGKDQKTLIISQVWLYTFAIPALWRAGQEYRKFKASLSFIVRPCGERERA
jgi:hypothetical protein